MILMEHFFSKGLILHIAQLYVSQNLILNVHLYNTILMFPLTFPIIFDGGRIINQNWYHDLHIIQTPFYTSYYCILNYKEN